MRDGPRLKIGIGIGIDMGTAVVGELAPTLQSLKELCVAHRVDGLFGGSPRAQAELPCNPPGETALRAHKAGLMIFTLDE